MDKMVDLLVLVFTLLALAGLIVGIVGLTRAHTTMSAALILPALFIAFLIAGRRWYRAQWPY